MHDDLDDLQIRQLAKVLFQQWLDGTLLRGLLVDSAELDVNLGEDLEADLIRGLLADPEDTESTEWDTLLESLRSDGTPEDLREVAVRIDERVRTLKTAS